MNSKEKGSFYTPKEVALWMLRQSLSNIPDAVYKNIRVLEPSCGNGVFLEVLETSDNQSKLRFIVDAVELCAEAFEKAKQQHHNINILNRDFLFWEAPAKYDLVIGNPPYIVKSKLTQDQAEYCKIIHADHGLINQEVMNIWTAFVLKSTTLLADNGILSFVLPTELLQVNYAQPIRELLLKNFQRVEIVSFRNLVFDTIDQDTVLLFAHKKSQKPGLYFAEVSEVKELAKHTIKFRKKDTTNLSFKWSSFILDDSDLKFLDPILKKCTKIADLCDSVAGIVTAANNYFIVSQKDINGYGLKKFAKPIIQKGAFVNGSAELSDKDYRLLQRNGKPCYLLDLNNVPEDEFTEGLVEYLELGKKQNIHQRYKCRLRNRWYDVPSVWKSEGFFFKRGHHYPKILVNSANVHVTDAAYRIRMKQSVTITNMVMSFYNTFTLLCAELFGRYYGGGVLELTPNEFKKLPIPYRQHSPESYPEFIRAFESKKSIEGFTIENDKAILSESYGFSSRDVSRIQSLYIKMKNRRLRGAA